MIAVDLDEGRVFHDSEIKERIAGDADYTAMGADFMPIADLDDPAAPSPACPYDRAELARRQAAAGDRKSTRLNARHQCASRTAAPDYKHKTKHNQLTHI